jgi:hypothetical protein
MPVLASQWLDPFHTFHMDDTQVIHASFSPNTPVQLTVSYVDLTKRGAGKGWVFQLGHHVTPYGTARGKCFRTSAAAVRAGKRYCSYGRRARAEPVVILPKDHYEHQAVR